MHAVKALAQHSSARPGSAWRVGVLPHYLSPEAEKSLERQGRHSGDTDLQGEDQRASVTSGSDLTGARGRGVVFQ